MADDRAREEFFALTPAQVRFREAVGSGQYTYLGYGGGIRSGKTALLLVLTQVLCRAYPKSRWAIVRKDLPTLRRNILPTFAKFRVANFCGAVNQSTWTATCANGSEIVFFTESISEDPELNRWRGLEVNGFFPDEANELQEASWRKMIERAGSWVVPGSGRQPPPLVIATFNPSAGWVKRVFYDPWKNGSLKAPFYFQHATIADNPHLPQSYVESLKNLPEREYKRFVEGDWSFIAGAYFDELGAATHLCARLDRPESLDDRWAKLPSWWTYWSSFDWGFRHPAVAMAFAKDGDGQRYLLDTVRMRRMSDATMGEKLAASLPSQCTAMMLAGHDAFAKREAHAASAESVADVFLRYGVNLQRASIARVQGWAALRRAFAIPKAPGLKPELLICDTPGNRWAIESLLELTPDPTDPEDVLKVDANEDGEGGDDAGDCLRYGIAPLASTPNVPRETRFVPFPADMDPVLANAMVEGYGESERDEASGTLAQLCEGF